MGALHEQFFKDLSAGTIESPTALQRHVEALHLELGEFHHVGVISPCSGSLSTTKSSSVISGLSSILDIKLSMRYRDMVCILLSHDQAAPMTAFTQKCLEEFLDANQLTAAFSHSFRDLTTTRQHWLQARTTLDYHMALSPHAPLAFFENCAIRQMIHHSIPVEERPDYLHPVVAILQAQDALNHTEYTQTLRTYVENLTHINATAAALNVHRNTLFYRLRYIQSLYPLDFDDADTLFRLIFSFHVLDISAAGSQPEKK